MPSSLPMYASSRSRTRPPPSTRVSTRCRRPTSTGLRTRRLSPRSSTATPGTCPARSTSRRCASGPRPFSVAMTSRPFNRPAATSTPPSGPSCRLRWGQTEGQTGVRPGSDRGQTGVRPGSDRGQTRVRPGSDQGQTPLVIRVTGDGFLRHMVRSIAGTLVDVGLGRWPASQVAQILAGRDRSRAGRAAPAAGLCLVRVDYRVQLLLYNAKYWLRALNGPVRLCIIGVYLPRSHDGARRLPDRSDVRLS